MDLWNNEVGREIGSQIKKSVIYKRKSEYPKERIEDMIAEEIVNLSIDDFTKYENYIDNQMKNFGIPNNFQAKQELKAGNLIWVDSYTRDDGTEVKGYYRRK